MVQKLYLSEEQSERVRLHVWKISFISTATQGNCPRNLVNDRPGAAIKLCQKASWVGEWAIINVLKYFARV